MSYLIVQQSRDCWGRVRGILGLIICRDCSSSGTSTDKQKTASYSSLHSRHYPSPGDPCMSGHFDQYFEAAAVQQRACISRDKTVQKVSREGRMRNVSKPDSSQ